MLLRFERTLSCGPEVAWFLLNDPRGMALWSMARVEILAPGDGSHPAGVGALRRVHVSAGMRRRPVDEVVVAADPPHRFVYRVIAGAPLRDHRGVITCEPLRRATRVRWEVHMEPHNRVAGHLLRRMLVPLLERSLDRLERAARHAGASALPPRRDLDETADRAALEEAAAACLHEQRALADAFAASDAPERWFTRVYEQLTDAQLRACRKGLFEHPAWVLRLIAASHRYYVCNLQAWMRRERSAVESHWLSAFRAMETLERRSPGPLERLGTTVGEGMVAHIGEDLPRALAEVWAQAYAGRCDYVRFRADYLAWGAVLDGERARLLEHIPKGEWPTRARVLRAVWPGAARRRWQDPHLDRLDEGRRQAFERGERIAAMLARASSAGARR